MIKNLLQISFLIFIVGCTATREKIYYAAPSQLPHTDRQMKTAGFWISQHRAPDEILLNEYDLRSFNQMTQETLKLTKDLSRFPSQYSGEDLKKTLQKDFKDLSSKGYFAADGRKATNNYFDPILSNMNLKEIPKTIDVQFGLAIHYADQRLLPTEEPLYAIADDVDFDELQNSALDVGTPVAVLHKSSDQKWLYVQSTTSDGWIKVEDVALGDFKQMQQFILQTPFVVVTKSKADIFLDKDLTQYYDYVQMGTKFPAANLTGSLVEIILPTRDQTGTLVLTKGFMNFSDIHQGYLSYTPRNILKQAFELLNAPYGWGGMYGEQDCSRFLQQIFSTVGIELPRNSSAQGQVGRELTEFNEGVNDQQKLRALLNQGIGGITLLKLKGHIMLYLGEVDGKPYAIHAVWAYRENERGADRIRVMNRVVVSDLSLGEGSKKGSLLERINSIRIVR